MYNLAASICSSTSQTSSEIAKSIKQHFLGAETPLYEGAKITKRTGTNVSLLRNNDDWKSTYTRREKQKAEGFFSTAAQPYEELGETELSTKSLVVNAMKEIGGIFDSERKPFFKREKAKPDGSTEKQDLPKKWPRPNGLRKTDKSNQNEHTGTGFERIKDLLDGAEQKLLCLKAGRPLIEFLDDNEKPDRKKRKKQDHNKRGGLIMETPDHFINKDSKLETCPRPKRQPDSKARKRFLAKIRCLKKILCCVINMKNRDLRSKNPLLRENLKLIGRDVNLNGTQPPPAPSRIPRLSAVPAVTLPNYRTHPLHNPCSSESGSPGPSVAGKVVTFVQSTDDFESTASKVLLNPTETVGLKAGIGLSLAKIGVKKSRSRISSMNPGHTGTRLETLDNFLCSNTDPIKREESFIADQSIPGKGGRMVSFFVNLKTALKPRRGAMFQNKGNFDIPIWQRAIQEEARREELKFGRKPKELKTKQPEDVEEMLQQTKKAFLKMKSRHANKLKKEIQARVGYYRQRFNCLEVSIFHEEDLKNLRNKVRELQRRESLDNTCPIGWFEHLCDEQTSLCLENDAEVDSEIKGLLQFTRVEMTTIAHLRAKLCLLVMSLPVYELCKCSMQQAFKIYGTNSNKVDVFQKDASGADNELDDLL